VQDTKGRYFGGHWGKQECSKEKLETKGSKKTRLKPGTDRREPGEKPVLESWMKGQKKIRGGKGWYFPQDRGRNPKIRALQ